MTDRENLIELVCEMWHTDRCIAGCNYPPCYEVRVLVDHLISNGVTVQKWIPVTEPPEENGYYLCCVLTSAIGDKVKYEQMPLYWEDDVWLYRHNSHRMCRNVTHWMPLPPPPKGE